MMKYIKMNLDEYFWICIISVGFAVLAVIAFLMNMTSESELAILISIVSMVLYITVVIINSMIDIKR